VGEFRGLMVLRHDESAHGNLARLIAALQEHCQKHAEQRAAGLPPSSLGGSAPDQAPDEVERLLRWVGEASEGNP
jgi:hypothetical protein